MNRQKTSSSLKIKILLATVGLVLLTSLINVSYTIWQLRSAVEQRTAESLESQSLASSLLWEKTVQEFKTSTALVARDPGLVMALEFLLDTQVQKYLEGVKNRDPRIKAIALLNIQSRIPLGDSRVLKELQPLVIQVEKTKKEALGYFDFGGPSVGIISPLLSLPGNMVGVLVQVFQVDQTNLDSLGIALGSPIFLTLGDQVVLSAGLKPQGAGKSSAEGQAWRIPGLGGELRGAEGLVSHPLSLGKDFYTIYAQPLTGLDGQTTGYLGVAESTRRLEESLANVILSSLVIALVTMGASGLSTYWIVGRLLLPLGRLVETLNAVTAGDLGRRYEVSAQDEIGVVGNYLNTTIETIDFTMKELKRQHAEMERFTYTISHDLKSPLITIKGFLGYVRESIRKGDFGRMEADLTRIEKASDKMYALMDDLLNLSRVGRVLNVFQPVDMGKVLQMALDALDSPLRASGVQLIQPETWPVVSCDQIRMVEVWQNLIENALKYVHPSRPLEMEAGFREIQGRTEFFLRDNGIGIPEIYREKVFQLFEKLDPATPGSGVGLALVKRIVEHHHGALGIEGALGEGSTFFFTING